MGYFAKMRGITQSPPRVNVVEIFWSWLGAFLGIAGVAFLHYKVLGDADLMLIVGSFGASAVLIYGAIKSPLAQPRNLIGGHLLSACIGVASYQLLAPLIWLAAAVAVATAIAVMHATNRATALIAVIGGPDIHGLGYFYAIMPIGAGALIMLLVALLVNNIPRHRQYPEFWW